MSHLLLSVVVATRNRDNNLKNLFRSLELQTIEPDKFEVVIVNYGGSKRTERLVESFQLANIDYLYVDEKGLFNESRSKNIGIKRARANLVFCVNADILMHPEVLETVSKETIATGKQCLYHLRRQELKPDKKGDVVVGRLKAGKAVPKSWFKLGEQSAKGDFQGTWISNWHKVGGYDERMTGWGAMDSDLEERLNFLGIRTINLPEDKIMIYHQHHVEKEVSRNNINVWLKRLKTPGERNTEWGKIHHKRKIVVISRFPISDIDVVHDYQGAFDEVRLVEPKGFWKVVAWLMQSVYFEHFREYYIKKNYDLFVEIFERNQLPARASFKDLDEAGLICYYSGDDTCKPAKVSDLKKVGMWVMEQRSAVVIQRHKWNKYHTMYSSEVVNWFLNLKLPIKFVERKNSMKSCLQ